MQLFFCIKNVKKDYWDRYAESISPGTVNFIEHNDYRYILLYHLIL